MTTNPVTLLRSAKPETANASVLARVTEAMRGQPLVVTLAPPLLLALIMGWLDFTTGWEVSLFIFYAAPIVLAVWWSGTRAGLFIAVVCGAVWWFANKTTNPYETDLGYIWALINREFYFCVVVFAVAAVRSKQDGDAARIRSLEERQQLERDIVSVSEHEQQRIGQDLHDGLCQQLAAIGCAARALADDLRAQTLPTACDATMIEESIQQAVMEARNLAHGICPVHMSCDGLAAALSDLARLTGRLTGVEIEVKEDCTVHVENPDASMHLYRIAQEAVANAVRHSGASKVAIRLLLAVDYLELRIEDDGTGIAAADNDSAEGMGLRTMRYRAQVLGATLEITPRTGGGTSVICRLPAQPQPDEDHGHN